MDPTVHNTEYRSKKLQQVKTIFGSDVGTVPPYLWHIERTQKAQFYAPT